MRSVEDNILATKSKDFAVRIVKLFKYLREDKHEFIMSKQLMRCGTSIGANVWEALRAESPADFVHKLRIALKETSESLFWITILHETDYLTEIEAVSIKDDCEEIGKILTTVINTHRHKYNLD